MLSIQDERVVMNINGLKCAFHMPTALVPRFKRNEDGSKGDEIVQNLPKGAPRFAFPVDEFPSCPTNWMNGSAKASSYWLPVRPGTGMWLDFNYNYEHSHHVAVVVSIQGVNPITGQQTKVLRLEQYRQKCPVHDVDFGQDRFCEQCGHKWDAQNYVSNNNTPRGLFWMDGFRGEDGVVRQYVFTEETCKGVAANVIGEDRVFAIGIAFYLSKEPKAVKPLAPELAAYDEYKGTNSVNYSGTRLTGFPPSNTISPSVRIGSNDLSFTQKLDEAKLKAMASNPQLLGVRTDPLKTYSHTEGAGITQPDAISDCRSVKSIPFGPAPEFPPIQFGNVDIPSVINCSIPTPPPPGGEVSVPPITMPCLDPESFPGLRNPYVPKDGNIRLRETNDFVDLSAETNRQSRTKSYKDIAKGGTLKDCDDSDIATFKRISIPLERRDLKGACAAGGPAGGQHTNSGYPSDDANALQQMASGDANVDMYYGSGTTTDFDGLEYSRGPARRKTMEFAPNESTPSDIQGDLRQLTPEEVEAEMKKLEITAGARIRQRIFQDPEDPDFWQEEPAGFIYINYVDIKTAEKIMEGGRQKRSGSYLDAIALG